MTSTATQPRASDHALGRGISIQLACVDTPAGLQCDPAARANASVARSLVEQNHDYGLFVMGSDATVETTVVRATWPRVSDQAFGYGLGIQLACVHTPTGLQCDTGAPSFVTVGRTLIESNHDVGLVVSGSEASVDASVVRATLPRAVDQTYGRGISIQMACVNTPEGLQCDPAGGSSASVYNTLVEHNYDMGLVIIDSAATVEASVIRTTLPRASDGIFGDGMSVVSRTLAASATITSSLIVDSARAGIANFGAFVSLDGTAIRCAAFELNAEQSGGGMDAEFDDRGGTSCGCPAADGACKAVSAGLQPPEPPAANE